MLTNNDYNLMEEITQLSKGLYRYDTYIKDATVETGGCSECGETWRILRTRHEEDLNLLLRQLKHHTDRGMLDDFAPPHE